MKAERLLSILLCLQRYGKMTTRQLAEKLEVSERTIVRDMEALSAAGVPVLAYRGPAGGWSLAEGYKTNLTGLRAGEIQSLLLANPTSIMNDLGLRQEYEAAFLKLLASLPAALQRDAEFMRERIHVDGAGWHQSVEAFPYLAVVQDAIWQEKQLRMEYPKGNEYAERTVDPLGLVAKGGVWYLVARSNEELRTFRISRIRNALMTDASFTRPADFQLAVYWEQSTQAFKAALPTYPAAVLLQEDMLPRLQHTRYVKIINTRSASRSGWIEAEVLFETLDSACAIILTHTPYIQAVQPSELKSAILEILRSALAMYEGS